MFLLVYIMVLLLCGYDVGCCAPSFSFSLFHTLSVFHGAWLDFPCFQCYGLHTRPRACFYSPRIVVYIWCFGCWVHHVLIFFFFLMKMVRWLRILINSFYLGTRVYDRCNVQNNLKLLMASFSFFFFAIETITLEVFRETAPRNIAKKFGQKLVQVEVWPKLRPWDFDKLGRCDQFGIFQIRLLANRIVWNSKMVTLNLVLTHYQVHICSNFSCSIDSWYQFYPKTLLKGVK